MTTPLHVHGADLSHHQSGSIDLAAAKNHGLRWLYHKATEGTTFIDTGYATRRAQAAAHGIPFGGYHFAHPKSDAATQARYFLAHAKPKTGDLRPALDLEAAEGFSVAQLGRWAAAFVAEIRKELRDVHPIIYTPFDIAAAVPGCLLWRPRYSNSNLHPPLHWDIWQFSDGVYGVPHTLPGLGAVDLNHMRDGLTVDDMRIPAPHTPAPTKETTVADPIRWKGDRLELIKRVATGYDPHGNPAQVKALKAVLAAVEAAPWVDEPTGRGTKVKAAGDAAKKAMGLK